MYEGSVCMKGGRQVAYLDGGAEAGGTEAGGAEDPSAASALIVLHGCPGSRLEAAFPFAPLAGRHGVRVVGIDRPGFGRSDPLPGRRLLDWPADVAAVADALGLERFAVYGRTAGAPYALATAFALGDRVTRVLLAAAIEPPGPRFREGMAARERTLYRLTRRTPALARALFGLAGRAAHRDADAFARRAAGALPAPDRPLLDEPNGREAFVALFTEAQRQGSAAMVEDFRIYGAPWGFQPAQVGAPVELWHGGESPFAPPAHAERLAAALADARLHRRAEAGHLVAWRCAEEILTAATAPVKVGA
jgi:pimeloyl-ACP methyl ester carboxylesterase